MGQDIRLLIFTLKDGPRYEVVDIYSKGWPGYDVVDIYSEGWVMI